MILSNRCLLFGLNTYTLFTHTICFLTFQTSFSTSLNPPKWSPLSKVKGVFLMSYSLTNLSRIFLLCFHNMVLSYVLNVKKKKKKKAKPNLFSHCLPRLYLPLYISSVSFTFAVLVSSLFILSNLIQLGMFWSILCLL